MSSKIDIQKRCKWCSAIFTAHKTTTEYCSHRCANLAYKDRVRKLGQSLSMPKVHPHKFRRTLATMAIDKGMPIEQVQRLLGHVRIDTTLHYAIVNQNNVKLAHKKYLG